MPVLCLQEFCLFAVVGLVSDFFLQMLFFTTVLSIDIRRMEVRRGLRMGFCFGSSFSAGVEGVKEAYLVGSVLFGIKDWVVKALGQGLLGYTRGFGDRTWGWASRYKNMQFG